MSIPPFLGGAGGFIDKASKGAVSGFGVLQRAGCKSRTFSGR